MSRCSFHRKGVGKLDDTIKVVVDEIFSSAFQPPR